MVLQQGIHRVLRQTLLRLPNCGEVLRGIGLCGEGGYGETGQQTRGKNNGDPMLPPRTVCPCFRFKALRERRAPKPGEIRTGAAQLRLRQRTVLPPEPFLTSVGCSWSYSFCRVSLFFHRQCRAELVWVDRESPKSGKAAFTIDSIGNMTI